MSLQRQGVIDQEESVSFFWRAVLIALEKNDNRVQQHNNGGGCMLSLTTT